MLAGPHLLLTQCGRGTSVSKCPGETPRINVSSRPQHVAPHGPIGTGVTPPPGIESQGTDPILRTMLGCMLVRICTVVTPSLSYPQVLGYGNEYSPGDYLVLGKTRSQHA